MQIYAPVETAVIPVNLIYVAVPMPIPQSQAPLPSTTPPDAALDSQDSLRRKQLRILREREFLRVQNDLKIAQELVRQLQVRVSGHELNTETDDHAADAPPASVAPLLPIDSEALQHAQYGNANSRSEMTVSESRRLLLPPPLSQYHYHNYNVVEQQVFSQSIFNSPANADRFNNHNPLAMERHSTSDNLKAEKAQCAIDGIPHLEHFPHLGYRITTFPDGRILKQQWHP